MTKKTKKEKINEAVEHILDGLSIDGAHHKQWALEQALLILKGKKWVQEYKATLFDEGVLWEKGIAS